MIRVVNEVAPGNLVKFQLFDADEDKGKPHYDWVKAHEQTFEQAKMLFDYGASIGQEVFFSVFGAKYVDWCKKFRVKRYKLSTSVSGEEKLYARIGAFTEIIASTAYAPPIGYAQNDCHESKRYTIKWLYCPEGYPQRYLKKLEYIYWFTGFSDHTIGIDVARIALARGAKILEKHFVLEHNPQFPDDAWSMTPPELKELVRWEKVCKEVR